MANSLAVTLIVVFSLLVYLILKGPILTGLTTLIARTRTKWDDALVDAKTLHRLSKLVPCLSG
ncbi:hypothetical protein [Candidatus Desulfatibia sp.]|uniref:hypothetical protein n=1 Tax=Candidatus Desulfatibia sp. TaxID=3101189 RepID=UPI0039B93F55